MQRTSCSTANACFGVISRHARCKTACPLHIRKRICAVQPSYFCRGRYLLRIIAIHDIPARIAQKRHHPHADAIHAAGWVSLFTLHVLWPFFWIWAMAYQPERGWGFSHGTQSHNANELEDLRRRVIELEKGITLRSRSAPRLKSPSTRSTGTISHCCVRSCCGCVAGRITYS